MYKIIIFIFALTVLGIECRKECASRQGKDSTYCVCNTTYCDDIPVIGKQPKGSALVLETSKGGNKLKESKVLFTKANGNSSSAQIVLTIDRKQRHDKWLGLGAAFTDSAAINIDSLPKEMAEQVVKDYFSSTGIEFSLVRITIGASDFSTRWYTYDDLTADGEQDFELKKFKLQDEDLKHKIPNINLAQKVSPHKIKFFGTAWYTPKWLLNKTSLAKNKDKHFTTFANYLVKFVDEYKKNGVPMWGMTIFNEPYHQWPYVMGFNNNTIEREFLNSYLGPALTKAGYTKDNFNLMMFDEGTGMPQPGKPDNPNSIVNVVDLFFNDTDTEKYIKGVAYHCYGTSNLSFAGIIREKHPDLFIMMSECCLGFTITPPTPPPKAVLGDWNQAAGYISGVMNNMKNNIQGWTEWNLALDPLGRPNQMGYRSDAPLIIDAQKKEYYKNPNFYALGHYSKFIIPDSVRLSVTQSRAQNRFDAVAYERPDNATVLVVYNLDNKDIDLVINDSIEGQIVHKLIQNSIQSYIYYH